jgi:predicted nucleotidyltransferase
MTIASPKEVRDGIIFKGLDEHYKESLEYFNKNQIVGLFLQGSQNYGLDTPNSDIDTKLIVIPSFKDIALAAQPVSTTHVRVNQEHIDFKDIRLYMNTFRKQNLNFLEILFTPFTMINSMYFDQWDRLIEERESIARMNPWRAVKSMKGIALEKYHAMEHAYPSKVDVLAKHGYDPKQLHHLVRVDNYLTRYIAGESYEECLIPKDNMKEFLLEIKRGKWPLEKARELAEISLAHVEGIADDFCEKTHDEEDPAMRELLEDVSYNIMKIAVEEELKND